MASQSSTIQIIFEGAVSGLQAAATIVEGTIGRVTRSADRGQPSVSRLAQAITILGKGFVVAGAGAASIQTAIAVVAGLTQVVTQLAPAALVLPGVLLAVAGAVGTLKIGMLGVLDAIKGDTKALAELSPAARATVEAIRGLESNFTSLKKSVQEDLFAGVAFEVKALAQKLFPVLNRQLPEIASGFNLMAVNALQAAQSPLFTGAVDKILGNTAEAVFAMSDSVAAAGVGFVRLGAVGSKFLPVLAKGINDVAERFATWVDQGINDGSIERLIQRAIDGFGTVSRILGNVAAGARAMGLAFLEGLGGPGGALATVEALSEAFRTLAISPEVQNALRAIGETVRVVGDAFRVVLATAIRELGPAVVAVAPFVQALAVSIRDGLVFALELIGPIALRVAEFLSRNKDVIIFLTPIIVGLIGVFKILRVVMLAVMIFRIIAFFLGFARTLSILVGGLRLAAAGARILFAPLLRIAGIVGLAVIADQVNEINLAAVGGDPSKLGQMESTLNNLVGAGRQLASGDFAGIFADIGSEWDMMISKFQTGESPAGAAFQKISASFQNDLVTPVSTAGAKIGQSFQTDFIGFFAGLPATISAGAQPVVDFFTNLPTTISTAMGDLGSAFTTKAQEIWTAFLGGLTSFFEPVRAFFAQSPYEMGFAIGSAIGQFIQVAIDLWNSFLQGCTTGITVVIAFCASVPGMIVAAVTSLVGLLVSWAVGAWNAAYGATVSAVATVVAFCAALPGKVIAVVSGLIAMAVNWARSTWTGVLTTTTSIIANVLSFVSQIPGRVISFLSSLPGQLRTNATNSWTQFQQGAVSVVTTVISFVQGIPGRVISALGDLGNLLVSRGRAIIDGLLAGIRAGVQAMFDFVSGIAAGIAARKGPLSYDRVLLKPAGLAIMQGLREGLAAGNKTVQTFVGTIAGNLADTLSAGASLTPLLGTVGSLGTLNPGVSPNAALPLNQAQLAAAVGATPPPITYVTVKIGDTELRGIVDEQVETTNREVARVVGVGTGRG